MLCTEAFNRTTTLDKTLCGFKAAGISPIDKERFRATYEYLCDIPVLLQKPAQELSTISADESRNETEVSTSNKQPQEQQNNFLPMFEPHNRLESLSSLISYARNTFP